MIAHAAPVNAYLAEVAYDTAIEVMYRAEDLTVEWPQVTPGRRSALATQRAREEGRERPRKLPGWPAWNCARPRGVLVCRLGGPGPEGAYVLAVSYRADKGSASVRVKVSAA